MRIFLRKWRRRVLKHGPRGRRKWESILMTLSEFGAEAGDEVGAFEVVGPVLDGEGEFVVGEGGTGEGAGGAELAEGEGAEAGEGFIAGEGEEFEVFVEEEGSWDAVAAADFDGVGEGDGLIAVDEAEVNARGLWGVAIGGVESGEVVEDGALLDAIAAPGAANNEEVDASGEGADEVGLSGCEADSGVEGVPGGLLVGGAGADVGVVGKCVVEEGCEEVRGKHGGL